MGGGTRTFYTLVCPGRCREQVTEKLIRAVGRGFIPGIKQALSIRALAPEECFTVFLLRYSPFSAASKDVPCKLTGTRRDSDGGNAFTDAALEFGYSAPHPPGPRSKC